ncbi:(2Fe-2S)-binding protein [Phyllobacterium bourgognense]|uniref:(2Fe-2S)-binding protein n=1 Tax=Phyllobacterium bourgognense TaxID=314236 RepID=UPI001FDED542|nr:hypothetical protein [Phyllobacterium bourgognense]
MFTDQDVRSAVDAERTRSISQVYACLGCSAQCGRCAHHPPHHGRGARERWCGILQRLPEVLAVKLMLVPDFRGRK